MNLQHEICTGCDLGILKVESTNQLNELRVQTASELAYLAGQHQQLIQERADEASRLHPTAAAHVQQLAQTSKDSLARNVPTPSPERVVCPRANTAAAGPKGWLKKCGACIVSN